MNFKDLKKDKRNYRKHEKENLELIKKSVDEVGLGRSIVIDNDNEIIAGNGLVSTLDKKTKIKVVETDGSELVVVKRTDLSTGDEKRKKLAVFDNSTSDSSSFDIDLLKLDFNIDELNNLGITLNDDELDFIPDDSFCDGESLKAELSHFRGLIYEKQSEKPDISDLYSDEGIEEFKKKINKSNVSSEEKAFLQKALTRFYKFNFRNIAEYYCHSDNEFRKLCEELVLVIPDGEKLLRNSLLKLDDDLYGDENEQ